MKLIGTSTRGRHAAGSRQTAGGKPAAVKHVVKSKKRMSGGKKTAIIICSVIGAIVVMIGVVAAVWWYRIPPLYDILFPVPTVNPGIMNPDSNPAISDSPMPNGDDTQGAVQIPEGPRNPNPGRPIEEVRNMNKFTFLVLGVDGYGSRRTQGGGNTDVVMVVSFDVEEHKVEVVNIPRDTVVNVPWSIKKINSIWANMSSKNRGIDNAEKLTMEATKEHFADFLGFPVDFWIRLDMEGFVKLVNSLPGGGVTYRVPYRISLSEPSIGLNVSLSAGEQKLNGMQALGVVRYRGGSGGDYARIDLQQGLLTAMAEQLLANKKNINPIDYADIFISNVKTDMDVSTIARFGRDLLDISSDDIAFHTAPSSPYTKSSGSGAGSYVTVHIDEWLDMINTTVSPYYDAITPQHVSILTRNANGRLYVTDDNWQGSRTW